MPYNTQQLKLKKSRQLAEVRQVAYFRATVAVGLVIANVWAVGVR